MELSLCNISLDQLYNLESIPLQRLNISLNYLKRLENLPRSLESLNVSNNQLSGHGIMLHLPSLVELNVQHNHIRLLEDSEEFQECFPSLRLLNIGMNSLKNIFFLESSRLEVLDLQHNDVVILCTLPPTLKRLNGSSNGMGLVQSRLPDTLEELDLSINKLRFAGLPMYWGQHLVKVDLHYNSIEQFPKNLPNTVEYLYLHNNRISSLPKELPENLKVLNMSYNHILSIPSYKKKKIKIAFFDHNRITQTEGHTWANFFLFEDNWNKEKHHNAQKRIKRCWKIYRIFFRLRYLLRIHRIKEELLQVSMMPERCYQLDTLSWFS